MKFHNTRLISIKGVIITSSLLFTFALSVFLFIRHTQNPLDIAIERQVQSSQNYRLRWERKGVLSASDMARLAKISAYIQQRQEMSDADLDFWVALLHRGPLKDTPSNWGLFYASVFGLADGRKHLSPSQQQKMYDAVLPYVSDAVYTKAMDLSYKVDSGDPTSPQSLRTGHEKSAIILLAQTHDPRALGKLDAIAHDDIHPELRQTASDYHDKLAAVLR